MLPFAVSVDDLGSAGFLSTVGKCGQLAFVAEEPKGETHVRVRVVATVGRGSEGRSKAGRVLTLRVPGI